MTKPLIVIALACALCSPAFADGKDDAKVHMEAAAAAYKEGRFQDVLVELNKAYALDPRPELHYSIGQVYVKLGRCDDAILAYESFLSSKPSRERADLANQAIATCKAQKAAQPVPPVQPPDTTKPEVKDVVKDGGPVTHDGSLTDGERPPNMEPEKPTTQPVKVDEPPVWYKDKLGLALTGGGVVFTLIGTVLYVGALGKADDAGGADNYGDSQSQYDDAKSQRTTATVLIIGGLAATGVGVWRLMKKKKEQERNVALVPTTSGGGFITFSGGF